MRTTEILSLAHRFFSFDNMDEIRKKICHDNVKAIGEMGFLIFSSGLMSQGFEITGFEDSNEAETIRIHVN